MATSLLFVTLSHHPCGFMSFFAGIIFSLSSLLCLCNVATNAPLTARRTNIFCLHISSLLILIFNDLISLLDSGIQYGFFLSGYLFVFVCSTTFCPLISFKTGMYWSPLSFNYLSHRSYRGWERWN